MLEVDWNSSTSLVNSVTVLHSVLCTLYSEYCTRVRVLQLSLDTNKIQRTKNSTESLAMQQTGPLEANFLLEKVNGLFFLVLLKL